MHSRFTLATGTTEKVHILYTYKHALTIWSRPERYLTERSFVVEG